MYFCLIVNCEKEQICSRVIVPKVANHKGEAFEVQTTQRRWLEADRSIYGEEKLKTTSTQTEELN